jgi:phosphomethylpyrimidine synthase
MARHGSDTRLRMDPHEALDLIEEQAERGVTLITVHATATLEALEAHAGCGRTILTTSRGGAAIANAISHTREQNVYWDHFDDILSIAEKCNITLSLGSTYRPGSICDATLTDPLYWGEIKRMAQLVERAISRRIPIMVEGIGHAPVHRMAEIIGQSKAICHNVPYRVLSVGTDIALGYDHIASAIAITVAGLSGADLATAITAAEHLGQPSLEEVIEGVVAAQIAAHCADLARLGDFSADFNMSQARCRLGCRGLLDYAIYPEGARKALASHRRGIEEQGCAMCGDACALLQSINKTWSDGMDASAS